MNNDEVIDDYHGNPECLCPFCDCPMRAHEKGRGRVMHCKGCGGDCELAEESAGTWHNQAPPARRYAVRLR